VIRAHVNAVKALLSAVPNVTVYDAKVPDNATYPYVVVYADGGLASVNNLAAASSWRDWRFQTTSVGTTPDQARLIAEKAQAALLDATPTVTGRSCGRIQHDVSRDIQRDDDVVPPVLYAVDRWRFSSVPA
jgi:hypothetical protein